MKALLLPALVLGTPSWLLAGSPCHKPCDAAKKAPCGSVQAVAQPGHPSGALTLVSAGEPKGQDGRSDKAPKVKVGKVEKTDKAPRSIVIQKDEGSDEDRANRGWLGVVAAPVPEALAAQLGTEGSGLIIQNVVEGSPADEAGFKAHDVIVSIDGQDIDGDVRTLVSRVGDRKPGEKLQFEVLREGQDVDIVATLGSRADQEAQAFEFKFAAPPDAELEDEVHTRGRFMFRTPEGKWVMRDLGDIADIQDLPDDVKMMLPESGSRTVQVYVEDGDTKVRTRVERDGTTLEVEQEGDEITVSRTDADGNETSETYASEDELQAEDAEAYKVLKGAGSGMYSFKIDGLNPGQMNFDVDLHGLGDAQWTERMHESLQAAQDAYEKALEEFGKLGGQAGNTHFFVPQGGPGGPGQPHVIGMRAMGKPKHTFEVRPDGTIEVRIRKGDSELVQLYTNERDLQKRNPELAEKYADLMETGK